MSPASDVRACVFDAYGTLLDLASAVEPHRPALGDAAPRLSGTLAGQAARVHPASHVDGALRRFRPGHRRCPPLRLATFGIGDPHLRASLLAALEQLAAYPDAAETLTKLRGGGVRTPVLSNGTPSMPGAGGRARGAVVRERERLRDVAGASHVVRSLSDVPALAGTS